MGSVPGEHDLVPLRDFAIYALVNLHFTHLGGLPGKGQLAPGEKDALAVHPSNSPIRPLGDAMLGIGAGKPYNVAGLVAPGTSYL